MHFPSFRSTYQMLKEWLVTGLKDPQLHDDPSDLVGVPLPSPFETDRIEARRVNLHERFDRLLVHYSLEHLIDHDSMLGWLRMVPLLEAMNERVGELRGRVLFGDAAATGFDATLGDEAVATDRHDHHKNP